MGHEEIYNRTPYKCDAVCVGRTEILYVNKERFLDYFSPKDINILFKYFPPIDLSKLLESIEAKERLLSKTAQAVLDATNVNMVNSSGRTSDAHDGLLRRLSPWIAKAKHKHTSNNQLLEYCKKIKVTKVTHKTLDISDPLVFNKMVNSYPKISFSGMGDEYDSDFDS